MNYTNRANMHRPKDTFDLPGRDMPIPIHDALGVDTFAPLFGSSSGKNPSLLANSH
jgi:hypothetical protein